jgi:hypothetical protein
MVSSADNLLGFQSTIKASGAVPRRSDEYQFAAYESQSDELDLLVSD